MPTIVLFSNLLLTEFNFKSRYCSYIILQYEMMNSASYQHTLSNQKWICPNVKRILLLHIMLIIILIHTISEGRRSLALLPVRSTDTIFIRTVKQDYQTFSVCYVSRLTSDVYFERVQRSLFLRYS